MMGGNIHKQHGFTLVELAVVIAVVGILTAITVVTYTDVQERATTTRSVAAAKNWQEVFQIYTARKRAYPPSTTNVHFCLGTGNPTTWDANPDEDCNATSNIKHPNVAFSTELESVVGKLPQYPPDIRGGASLGTTVGIGFRTADTLNPATTPQLYYPMLHYWLDGNNTDCGLRPVATVVSGGYVKSTSAFTANDGPLTKCIILLPDPSTL